MAFTSFEEIDAWQDARVLVNMLKKFRLIAEQHKDWSWSDQIGRSSLSIMANIAEGNDSLSDSEFIRFLGYAKRSAAETRSHLYYGLDQEYFSREEFMKVCDQSKKIASKISRLIGYLRKNNRVNQKTFNV